MHKNSRRSFLKNSAMASGAAIVGACSSNDRRLLTQPHTPNFYPTHNERTKGWLRFLWQKSTFPDDWSYTGEEKLPWGIGLPRDEINWDYNGKGPHPWWDQYSSAPMLSYPRFDLTESSYAVMLMADQTPAWREVYTRIMDELATRHTAYWAAIDWNTFIGPSPNRMKYADYPELAPGSFAWPERVIGNYDRPGWTANGVQPWGLQPDPIGADGNLFFRGWLNLLLSTYKYVSGDDKWERPWMIAGYENQQFEWTQPRMVEHLHRQYTDHPEGPHCENTKVWPICNSAAGLGIYLSDQLGTSNAHGIFENWIEFMKDNYMSVNSQNQIESMTLYYDPLADFKVTLPGVAAGTTAAFYLMPQSPEIATQIYDSLATTLGWRDPKRAIEPSALGLVMAKALGDHTAVARLSAAAERYSEPRWFGENMDKFGWWFNNGEPWPRGQSSAQMMITEITEGSWIDAFKVKHLDKYTAPTVEGIDFPALGVEQAWNDKESGVLHVGTYAADRNRLGAETSWRVTGLPNARDVFVLADGSPFQNVEVINNNSIIIRTDINHHRFQIFTGYHGQQTDQASNPPAPETDSGAFVARQRTAAENAQAAESVLLSGSANCPCCAGAA